MLFEEGAPREFLAIIVSRRRRHREAGATAAPSASSPSAPAKRVGEGLLLDDSPHGTSARAVQPTDAFVLSRRAGRRTCSRSRPTLYAALVGRAARAISQRLAATDATLVGRGRTLGFGGARTRASTTCSASARCPTMRSTACRRCARSRTSRSPASPLREFPALDRGARRGEGSGRARQRRARAARPRASPTLIVRAAQRDPRRPAPRALPRRHDPGRRRHVDEHERERGDREPRARAARARSAATTQSCTRTITSTSASRRTTSIRRR